MKKNTVLAKNGIFLRFFLIFSETVLCRELGFLALRSVHQDASFELSKSTFLTILPFVIIMGGGGGQILTRTTKIGLILKTKTVFNSGRQTAQ